MPITIVETLLQSGIDFGSVEGCEGQYRASTNGGLVIACRQDRRQSSLVTDRTERRNRRFARMQRYVAGTVFVGLGVTAALTGSASSSK